MCVLLQESMHSKTFCEIFSLDSSSKKKSKKHKKHKKKHSRSTLSDAEEIDVDVVNNDEMSCSSQDEGKIKLKIKFGGRTISTTEYSSSLRSYVSPHLFEELREKA